MRRTIALVAVGALSAFAWADVQPNHLAATRPATAPTTAPTDITATIKAIPKNLMPPNGEPMSDGDIRGIDEHLARLSGRTANLSTRSRLDSVAVQKDSVQYLGKSDAKTSFGGRPWVVNVCAVCDGDDEIEKSRRLRPRDWVPGFTGRVKYARVRNEQVEGVGVYFLDLYLEDAQLSAK